MRGSVPVIRMDARHDEEKCTGLRRALAYHDTAERPGSESASASGVMPDPALSDAMPDPTIHTLHLSPELRDQMVIHMVREAPNEGVGLLAITQDAGIARATAFFPGENIDASPTRFTMHPRDVVTALDTISEQGWKLGAIVHSHLKGPASPSRTDVDEAQYPGALMVIVSLAHLPPDIRVWRLDSEGESVVKRRVELDVSDHDGTKGS